MKLSRLIGFALVMPTDASCPETNVDEVNVWLSSARISTFRWSRSGVSYLVSDVVWCVCVSEKPACPVPASGGCYLLTICWKRKTIEYVPKAVHWWTAQWPTHF
jgi:hypothetical protein